MAVAFRPIAEDRGGSVSVSDEGRVSKTYTKAWKADASAGEDEAQVLAAFIAWANLSIFTPHPNDATARLRKIDVSQDGGFRFWLVTVEFSTRTPDEDDSEHEDPLQDPVKRSVSTAQGTRILEKDTEGKPILNAAGDAFDPPIEIPESGLIFRFVRNEPDFSTEQNLQFIDHISSSQWGGTPAGTVRCNSIEEDEQFRNGIRFVAKTYEFEYVKRGWQPNPLQQGLRELVDGERKHILDADGQPISTPVPLDAQGKKIDPDLLPGAAVFAEVDGYPTANFNLLNLPV